MDLRPALPDDDRAGRDLLPGEALDPESLGLGVSSVAGGPAALLVRHGRTRVTDHTRSPVQLPVGRPATLSRTRPGCAHLRCRPPRPLPPRTPRSPAAG